MAARAALSVGGNRLLQRLGVQHPIILAPMAGCSTPELVAAVADAGGLAMYGAGTTPKESLVEALRSTKKLIRSPEARFGVNLFVPSGFHVDRASWTPSQCAAVDAAARMQLSAMAELSEEPTAPSAPASLSAAEAVFAGQVDALLEEGVRTVSFHFGWPPEAEERRLRAAGVALIGNATNVKEAKLLESLGADAIIAQGLEAGGHRGTFVDAAGYRTSALMSTHCLLRAVTEAVGVPVIAAGGLMDGVDAAAALVAGASAAQFGTAFLTTTECKAPPGHKRALLRRGEDATPTVITQGFTGKPARALVNSWVQGMSEIESQLPNCFNSIPAGRILQGHAVQREREDIMYMWAGQGYTRCRPEMGAAQLVGLLVSELHEALPPLSKV